MSLVAKLPCEKNEEVLVASPSSPRAHSFSNIRISGESSEGKVGVRKCSIGLLTEMLRKHSASIVDVEEGDSKLWEAKKAMKRSETQGFQLKLFSIEC